MKSGKQRKAEIKNRRKIKMSKKLKRGVHINPPLLADWTKLRSPSCLPNFPNYYYDKEFNCRDCGAFQLWTPRQQKWWYEEIGGNIETTALRCRSCRLKERLRKLEARRVHLEGMEKKNASKA